MLSPQSCSLIVITHVVQERLTKEIAEAILYAVHPTGVGVVVEATYVLQSYPLPHPMHDSPTQTIL